MPIISNFPCGSVNPSDLTNYEVAVAESTSSSEYAKVYTLSQGGSEIATINIPKDMVVESGSVVTNPTGLDEGTYLKLVLANADDSEIYINVSDLIEYVTSGSATSDEIVINIDSSHKVTATHANSGATAGSYGDSAAQTPAFGGTFKVLYATVNSTGHVTAISAHTVTIPSTVATTSAAGLMSAADKTKLDGISTGANAYTHPSVTASDTTSTASPAHGGTVTMIDSVTRDTSGHVTGVNTKTVTLPSDNNTDTKVTQTLTSTSASYPLLLAPSGQTATTTTTANFGTKFQANPSTGVLTVTTFSGSGASLTSLNASNISSGTLAAARLATSGVTAASYGPSADASPAHSGTFSVPYITVDSYGRVTAAATKTITLPSDNNTDTKVTNTLATTTKAYVTGTTSSSTNTGTQVFDTGVYLDTTAGKLTATTFSGALSGNATTATTLATARTIQTNLASTSSASFNGSANITPGVTGTLPIANGGTGNTTGLAASATILATARTIDGVSFNGSAAITHYGTCSTANATAAKTVSLTGFSLVTGARVVVYFTYANTASAPTLNVNSTGAKNIVGYGTTVSGACSWSPNSPVEFIYNGTSWVILSIGREGYNTVATGAHSHAEGYSCTASGTYSHAEGSVSTASGWASHAEGYSTTASGDTSHAEGYYTTAYAYNTVIGHASKIPTAGSIESTSGDAFVIGNGTTDQDTGNLSADFVKGNAFRVTYAGKAYGLSAFTSSGADYAEFIKPWVDGNPDEEDRVGYFVTLEDGYLRKAQSGDFIAGITSGNPSVVGNGDEDYYWKYERDEFDRFVYEDVPEMTEQLDEDGNLVLGEDGRPVMVATGETIKNGRMKLSEDYDASLQEDYVERKDRPEWDYVGMVGVLPVRDDGTCEAGGWCCCGDDGVATSAETRGFDTYFVIERISDSVVRVLLK